LNMAMPLNAANHRGDRHKTMVGGAHPTGYYFFYIPVRSAG
jgi:hypothetical protein